MMQPQLLYSKTSQPRKNGLLLEYLKRWSAILYHHGNEKATITGGHLARKHSIHETLKGNAPVGARGPNCGAELVPADSDS